MKYTKTTEYVAPLIKLFPNAIPGFINCYISQEHDVLYVFTTQRDTINNNHDNYLGAYKVGNMYCQSFSIPFDLIPDVDLIMEGKYSHISEKALDNIKSTPGIYRFVQSKNITYVVYENAYYVVTKDPALGEPLAQRLGVPLEMLPEYDSKPIKEQEYYDLNKDILDSDLAEHDYFN